MEIKVSLLQKFTQSWVIKRIGSVLLDIGLPVLRMRIAD